MVQAAPDSDAGVNQFAGGTLVPEAKSFFFK